AKGAFTVMNRAAVLAASFFFFALYTAGCAKPAPTNSSAGNAIATAPRPTPIVEATPHQAAIGRELLRMENELPRIIREPAGQAVQRMEAEDAHLLSWDGSVSTRDDDIKDIQAGSMTAQSMELKDLRVKILNQDAAVVTGSMVITGGKYKAEEMSADVS